MSGPPELAWVEIDLDAFDRNTSILNQCAGGAGIGAVVKANAYGHGLVGMAEAAVAAGAARLCVFNLDEAEALRRAEITAPILVLGVVPAAEAPRAVALGVAVAVSRPEGIRALSAAAQAAGATAPVHLKIESGMQRLGAAPEAALGLAALIRRLPGLWLEGVCTQLPSTDGPDVEDSRRRLHQFTALADAIGAPIRHAANSAALFRLPESALEMVRPGLGLYGIVPEECAGTAAEGLRPVLSWKARVVQVHAVPAGESVSYGGTWTATRDSRIGVVPVGYSDGLRRAYAGCLRPLVRGRRTPIVGLVCMDLCMLDLTDVPEADVGEPVVLIGEQGGARITVPDIAHRCAVSPYEVLTGLGARLPRVYLRGGRPVSVQTMLDQTPHAVQAPSVEAVLAGR